MAMRGHSRRRDHQWFMPMPFPDLEARLALSCQWRRSPANNVIVVFIRQSINTHGTPRRGNDLIGYRAATSR